MKQNGKLLFCVYNKVSVFHDSSRDRFCSSHTVHKHISPRRRSQMCAAVTLCCDNLPQLKTEEKKKECSIISAKSPEKELLICVYSSDDTGMFGEVCDKILLLKFVDLVLMY